MKLHSDLPVYKATYDLLLAIFQFTKDFSKEYKYIVGESLKDGRNPYIGFRPEFCFVRANSSVPFKSGNPLLM